MRLRRPSIKLLKNWTSERPMEGARVTSQDPVFVLLLAIMLSLPPLDVCREVFRHNFAIVSWNKAALVVSRGNVNTAPAVSAVPSEKRLGERKPNRSWRAKLRPSRPMASASACSKHNARSKGARTSVPFCEHMILMWSNSFTQTTMPSAWHRKTPRASGHWFAKPAATKMSESDSSGKTLSHLSAASSSSDMPPAQVVTLTEPCMGRYSP
mmetsp:Transcript_67589/g.220011  ORF Transcript_67589/g.220011 Transcript_67589/m.220011 type:complete len:211 (-) Transcript_67589:1264-1896(-)